MDDNELEILVLQAQLGRRSAMKKLFEHLNPALTRYAYAQVKNSMVAEDLTQNVWLKIHRRIGKLNDVSLFKSWLYKALRWEISDWLRKSKHEILLAEHPDDRSICGATSAVSIAIPLLQNLEQGEKDAAELYYLNDLTVKEVSIVLGIPQGTVKSRLHRARQTIKQQIEQNRKEQK